MKHLAHYFGILVLVFLVGCGNKGQEIKGEVSTECAENSFFNTMSDIVECENGYYMLRETFNGSYITYMSKDNPGNETFLCSKPDCKHMDLDNDKTQYNMFSDCNAYLGENVILNSIKYYEGNLYILAYEEGETVLYRISKDGNIHDRLLEIGTLSRKHSGSYHYIVNGSDVYVLYSGEGYKKNEVAELSKWSLEKKEKEVLVQDNEHWCDTLKMYNGGVFFRRTDVSTGTKSIISRYDINTNKIEDIVDGAISMYTIDNIGNSILYWKMDEGLVRHNLNTGKAEVIRPIDSNIMNAQLACNGKYVYLHNNLTRYVDADIDDIVEVIDLSTEKVVAVIPSPPEEIGEILNGDDELIIAKTVKEEYVYIRNDDIAAGKELKWEN